MATICRRPSQGYRSFIHEYYGKRKCSGYRIFEGGLLGENLLRQRDVLYNLPSEDYRRTITDIANRLKQANLQFAVDFVNNMVSIGSREIVLGNIFSLAIVAAVTILFFKLISRYAGIGQLGLKEASANNPIFVIRSLVRVTAMTKQVKILALVLGGLALFTLVDIPQTVRIKALIINMLPLDAQTKRDAVVNLCRAAYAGTPGSMGVIDCYEAHH